MEGCTHISPQPQSEKRHLENEWGGDREASCSRKGKEKDTWPVLLSDPEQDCPLWASGSVKQNEGWARIPRQSPQLQQGAHQAKFSKLPWKKEVALVVLLAASWPKKKTKNQKQNPIPDSESAKRWFFRSYRRFIPTLSLWGSCSKLQNWGVACGNNSNNRIKCVTIGLTIIVKATVIKSLCFLYLAY